ncbi:cation-translocating P-type ATPase [Bacillus sp. Bva_UNVM-123]|uniref:heavy metal translocating P-type ATPase n=1 Tax=Bacillus sp. Bva_UNVM-123 TaxID=2829798 RepID=UPI00391F656C
MKEKRNSIIVWITAILLVGAVIFHIMNFSSLKTTMLITSTVIAGFPIMMKAFQSARMKAFSIELLVTIAVIGALFIGEYVESAVVTFLFLFGAYLEARTLAKTRSSLKSLMDMAPVEAKVIRNEQSFIVPVEELNGGDHILIQSGERVAIDGKITAGSAYINEAAITGESIRAHKKIGDRVYSGTIIDTGYIEVIAEKVGDDTTFAKIIELVEEAQEAKAKTQKFVEKFANLYTPGIVIFSSLVYFMTKDIELTLTFLVIACPGALVISAPVSIVAGIGNGAKNGVLIKGGEMIEQFARVNAVMFDKTGTLTIGRPEITSIHAYSMEENELLQLVAQAEMISEHHLGQAIILEAKKRNLAFISKPRKFEIIKGLGITGLLNEKPFVIGNCKLMVEKNIFLDEHVQHTVEKSEKEGNTTILVVYDHKIAGIISIADKIRPEAGNMITNLKKNGIKKVYMLTGDNRHTANLVAKQLGIDHVFAEMLPEDKIEKVKLVQNEGYRVAMVGDGINDAPAIAAADIGVAMGGAGTDVAMETADVVLMADKLDKLTHAHKLAKATVRNMKQNTFIAVGTVFLLLIGVLMKKVFLSAGMLIHELSVLIVIINAIRLVRYNHKKGMERNEVIPHILSEKGV